jgi:hypothetical protein
LGVGAASGVDVRIRTARVTRHIGNGIDPHVDARISDVDSHVGNGVDAYIDHGVDPWIDPDVGDRRKIDAHIDDAVHPCVGRRWYIDAHIADGSVSARVVRAIGGDVGLSITRSVEIAENGVVIVPTAADEHHDQSKEPDPKKP